MRRGERLYRAGDEIAVRRRGSQAELSRATARRASADRPHNSQPMGGRVVSEKLPLEGGGLHHPAAPRRLAAGATIRWRRGSAPTQPLVRRGIRAPRQHTAVLSRMAAMPHSHGRSYTYLLSQARWCRCAVVIALQYQRLIREIPGGFASATTIDGVLRCA